MMSNDTGKWESEMDFLLNDGLDARRRLKALQLIAENDLARDTLKAALELQDKARAACGYGQVCAAMPESLGRLMRSLARQPAAPKHRRANRRNLLQSIGRASRLLRVAAVVVAGVLIYIFATAYRADRTPRGTLAQSRQQIILPKLGQDELANYRKVWTEVLDQNQKSRLWVMMSDDGGQFGYVPAADKVAGRDELVLVRCVLLGSDGKSVRKMNLLVPAHQQIRLSLPDASRQDDLRISYEIWVEGQQARVGLTVGDDLVASSGLYGGTDIGRKPTEIGRFVHNGKTLRAVLQAVPLNVVGT